MDQSPSSKVIFPSINEQMDEIRRGAVDLITEEDLVKKLERSRTTGTPLTVKWGADPSSADLHIGHGVVLRKLRAFQDLGHKATLIVGDFTAMIGDPSGRSKTRPMLTEEQTRANAATYVEQVTKVLDASTLAIRYNSEWLGAMTFADVIRLAATYTVSQMLEREDFHKRFNEEQPISLHELLYPLAQGMDSVAIRSDIELGGTDQKFNLLVGRELQRHYKQEPQCVLTTPLIEGTDGERKMSKSYGNSINFNDPPDEMVIKVMKIPDKLIYKYFELATNYKDLVGIKAKLNDQNFNPRDLKLSLSGELCSAFYGTEIANQATENWINTVAKKELPEDIQEHTLDSEDPVPLVSVLVDFKLAPSKSEARRKIQDGAVTVDGEKTNDLKLLLYPSDEHYIIKYGKVTSPIKLKISHQGSPKIRFDIFEWEHELIPGMAPNPTLGIQVVNEKYTILIEDVWVENEKQEKVISSLINTSSEEFERILPKKLLPFDQFIFRFDHVHQRDTKFLRGCIKFNGSIKKSAKLLRPDEKDKELL